MAIIDPEGLFLGDRMGLLSTMARLHWPYLFLLSNAFGRFEISYPKIVSRAYSTFSEIPTRDDIHGYVREYHSAFLLFLYKSDGSVWGQWDTSERYLKSYKDAISLKSPAPDPTALTEWRDRYVASKSLNVDLTSNGVSLFEKLSKNTPTFLTGKGIGNGVGDGIGNGKNLSSPDPGEDESVPLFRNLETPEPPARPSLESLQEQWFREEFWPAYWRRVDRADALKAFRKYARTEFQKDQIVAAVKAHAPQYQQRDPEHRPHASTWLNKKRHEEPPEDLSVSPSRPQRRSVMDGV